MVLYHTHHTKTIISLFAHAYKPGILCACRPGLTGWPRPINIPGYLSHIPPRLATKQRRLIPAPHPVNHRMHHITVPLGAHSKHNWGEWWVGEPGGSWPTSRHQHLTIYKGGDNWLLSNRYRGSPVALLFGCNWHLLYLMWSTSIFAYCWWIASDITVIFVI